MIAQRQFLPQPIDFLSCNFGGKAGPPRILSIGRDASKLSTRACNLRSATGCSVKSAPPEAVSNLVIANFYRVALFDDGLRDAETAELAVCAHASDPRTKLVLLAGSTSRPSFIEALFDVVVFASEGPAALTRSVQDFFQQLRLYATKLPAARKSVALKRRPIDRIEASELSGVCSNSSALRRFIVWLSHTACFASVTI